MSAPPPLQDMDWENYISTYCLGVRRFILKEEDKAEKAQRRLSV